MNPKELRIVFMGTPEFAVPSLRALVAGGYNVVGVVTTPDKPAGRGQKLHRSDVKLAALELGLPVLQPEKLKAPEFVAAMQALRPDLGIVIAFRMLPEVIWAMPRLGTFNLHASLLPQYRGAAPINWAVINGETTGSPQATSAPSNSSTSTNRHCTRRPRYSRRTASSTGRGTDAGS